MLGLRRSNPSGPAPIGFKCVNYEGHLYRWYDSYKKPTREVVNLEKHYYVCIAYWTEEEGHVLEDFHIYSTCDYKGLDLLHGFVNFVHYDLRGEFVAAEVYEDDQLIRELKDDKQFKYCKSDSGVSKITLRGYKHLKWHK